MDNLNNVLQSVREDDFVEYFLFPQVDSTEENEQETVLKQVLGKASKIVEKHAKDYLWHKDEFKLSIRTDLSNYLTHIDGKEENLPPHLYGVTHYGDNIEDEWFIVFLLREITKDVPGVVARVYDSDGEFLLIEAADFLPHWANPETCENRVYLYEGNLHLISPEDMENPGLSIKKGLSKIWEYPTLSLAPQDIQNSIKNKLTPYPNTIKSNQHHATVYVPTAICGILKEKPNLISAAVQAFCNRDSIDLKACRAMKFFPPEQRVKTRVKFTKCLYAMLLRSKYAPERKIGWNLPSALSKNYKECSLGVKVACGFEILVSQAKPSQEIRGDRGWVQYLKSLSEKGYFRGLLEGSRDYNNLLNKAKEHYINHRDSMQYSPAVGQEILDLLRNLDVNFEALQKEQSNLPPDDDESWLDISPEELDKMLREKYGQKKTFTVDSTTEAGTFAQKVNGFLNHVSDVQGAEFPEEKDSEAPERPSRKKSNKKGVSFVKESKTNSNGDNNNKVNFDPNSFASAIQNILNFVIPEDDSWDLESDSDMSEYENEEYVSKTDLEEDKDGQTKSKMEKYMAQMDRELAGTTMGKSFEKKRSKKGPTEESFEDIESFEPVDIDVNALKNILESYRSQLGEAGPSSNMLGPMGVSLDPKD